MAYQIQASGQTVGGGGGPVASVARAGDPLAELRVFWGPDICRLEYLVHLLDTGRIKDEQAAVQGWGDAVR